MPFALCPGQVSHPEASLRVRSRWYLSDNSRGLRASHPCDWEAADSSHPLTWSPLQGRTGLSEPLSPADPQILLSRSPH